MDKMPNDKLFRLTMDQLPSGMALTNSKGYYIYVNPAWESFVGFKASEVVGKQVREVFPNTGIYEAIKNGRALSGISVRSRDGKEQVSNYFPIYDEGELTGCCIQIMLGDSDDRDAMIEIAAFTERQLNYYKKQLTMLMASHNPIDNIVGSSESINAMKAQIKKAAATSSTVLIEGETGCGKELVAQSIHTLSSRGSKPMLKINCAAIPPTLAESELFGYENGAFTGAQKGGKGGLFETANKSTLFLDEIHQLEYFVQPKLLRVLQEHEVTRVGGSKSVDIDVRLVAATNMSLMNLVKEKKFREDLFYRLNVITIRVPPLRERLDDISELADFIINQLNNRLGLRVEGIEEEALRHFREYYWPGNIRELQNVIERAMNMEYSGILTWDCLWEYFADKHLKARTENENTHNFDLKSRVSVLEKDVIGHVYKLCSGNKRKTAEMLGISRTLLYQKLKEYQIAE